MESSSAVTDLKQACLDLSNRALELFDRFDEHGLEAAWVRDGVLVVARMEQAHEVVRSFLERQATRRMLALGVTPEQLARITMGKS